MVADYFETMGFGPNGWGWVMLRASGMTIFLSVTGFFVGNIFGALAAIAKLANNKVLNVVANTYLNIVRGVPELVLIYIVFYESSSLVTTIAQTFGYPEPIFLPVFPVAVTALGVISGAYLAEVFRAAFLTIHKGELEAARSVGMAPGLMFRRIIIPQVLRYAVPGIGNVWQFILKESSLISVIGVVEIMRQTKMGAGSTHKPFTFFITAAILFIVIAFFTGVGFRKLEQWSTRGMKRE
ncbi:MAG: ABC transporter permease subunit [Methylobacteriaceae bacterium]|jgi:octopine/nopaline transport system permease protein|nr:ABC transporter permease subunit [Methylobacteriaceae bacterium]